MVDCAGEGARVLVMVRLYPARTILTSFLLGFSHFQLWELGDCTAQEWLTIVVESDIVCAILPLG